MKIGFNHEKYLEEQSKYILERVNNHDKLYIEFGGKLLGDLHAKRVLPGFDENAKIKVLNKLKDKIEVIICVYAGDIERNKIRGDFGITYDMDVFRLIDDLRENDLKVNSVVITRYEDRPSTDLFITRLERRGIKVYKHYATKLQQKNYTNGTQNARRNPAHPALSGVRAVCLSSTFPCFVRHNCHSYGNRLPLGQRPFLGLSPRTAMGTVRYPCPSAARKGGRTRASAPQPELRVCV